MLFHGASPPKIIARVERSLPRDGPHPLTENSRLNGFIVGFVHQARERIGRLRRFRRNRLMLGKVWLTPDAGIVRIFVG